MADAGCDTPADGDYDADDDGLIEVCTRAQLNAIHWDLNGDGSPISRYARFYGAAFPNADVFRGPASGPPMGCPQTGCQGYELAADLDFDTNGNGRADVGDRHIGRDGSLTAGWRGFGHHSSSARNPTVFTAVFEGNGHVIRNLYVESLDYSGLFGETGAAAVIRNVGVQGVLLEGNGRHVGGLVGHNGGSIINSYVTGSVSGRREVGGLVGQSDNTGRIIGSHSTVTVTGSSDHVGGLVGVNNQGAIVASYATGSVTNTGNIAHGTYVPEYVDGNGHATGGLVGLNYKAQAKIIASYATGAVSAPQGAKAGGLVGYNLGRITASYSPARCQVWRTWAAWPTATLPGSRGLTPASATGTRPPRAC